MKKKLLKKIIKKDFNNELEQILEGKKFSEEAKNLLLGILYKLDATYNDYLKTKVDTNTKEEYLEYLLTTIKKECDEVETIKISQKKESNLISENRNFEIDKKSKKITTYPIDRKLLYAIFKMGNQDNIVRGKNKILNLVITDLINIGSNMDLVEPIRDFNGYSWVTSTPELESMYHNLIYQNLRILVGNNILKKLTQKEFKVMHNYDDMFEKIEAEYGEDLGVEIQKELGDISLLLYILYYKKVGKQIYEIKNNLDEKYAKMEDSTKFLKEVITKKAKVLEEQEKLESIILDEKKLEREYNKRNKRLGPMEKIFSKKILIKNMEKEICDLDNQIEYLDQMTKVEKILEEREVIRKEREKLDILDDLDLEDNKKIIKRIDDEMIDFQDMFLDCLQAKIEKIETKEEINSVIKSFRYYLETHITEKQKTQEKKELKGFIETTKRILLEKGVELKALPEITDTKEVNNKLLSYIFTNKVMDLDKLTMKFEYVNEELYLNMFDENTLTDKKYIGGLRQSEVDKIIQKKNRKIKILI